MKVIIFGKSYTASDILIILAYLILLLILAILIWKFISPVLAVIVSAVIAYALDLRKLFQGKK